MVPGQQSPSFLLDGEPLLPYLTRSSSSLLSYLTRSPLSLLSLLSSSASCLRKPSLGLTSRCLRT